MHLPAMKEGGWLSRTTLIATAKLYLRKSLLKPFCRALRHFTGETDPTQYEAVHGASEGMRAGDLEHLFPTMMTRNEHG